MSHSTLPPLSPLLIRICTLLRLLGALLGDVAGLATVVAGLGTDVVATSSRTAVLGDVASLTAGVALQGTGLAVTGKVVGATALVASGGVARTSTGSSSSLGNSGTRVGTLSRAVLGDVAKLTTVVALGALRRGGAVRLDVANITTRVALLGGGLLGVRAVVGLVPGLAAVVAQSLLLGAVVGQVANLTTLVTRSREHSSHLSLSLETQRFTVCKRMKIFPTGHALLPASTRGPLMHDTFCDNATETRRRWRTDTCLTGGWTLWWAWPLVWLRILSRSKSCAGSPATRLPS